MAPPPRQPRIVPPEAAFQWLFSPSDMAETPSVRFAHLSPQHERSLRAKGVNLINRIGEYLRLPQSITSTASIFLHRFYMRRSLNSETLREQSGYAPYEMAATSVFLACKCEETSKKLGVIVEATMASLDKSSEGAAAWSARKYKVNIESPEFRRWKDIILTYEERLLDTLCFDLIVDHPHKVLVVCASELKAEKLLTRTAWAVLNDCLHDAMCVMFDPPVLAAGAFKKTCDEMAVDPAGMTLTIALDPAEIEAIAKESAQSGNVAIEKVTSAELTWLDVFDVDETEVAEVVAAIEDAYSFHQAGIGKRTNPTAHRAGFKRSGAATPAGVTTPLPTPGNATPHVSISRSSSESAGLRRPMLSPDIAKSPLADGDHADHPGHAEPVISLTKSAPTANTAQAVPIAPLGVPADFGQDLRDTSSTVVEMDLSMAVDANGNVDADESSALPARPQSRHGPIVAEATDGPDTTGTLTAVGESTDTTG